jgi:hypothetical protein
MSEWKDALFKQWLDLRNAFKANKKIKNWSNVINICNVIIQLDSQAKFIGIMVPIFYKEMANAYEKNCDISNAIKFYSLARDGFIKYHAEKSLRSSNDWLPDIDKIDKKIIKLSSKIET